MAGNSFIMHEDDDFPPDFKEYMERELKWLRLEIDAKPRDCKSFYFKSDWKGIRWVFWSRQDDDPIRPPTPPTLSHGKGEATFLCLLSKKNFVDFIPDPRASPRVRDNIRHALQKAILCPSLNASLVQFWAPTKTLEGRTLLTTQFQPFALGKTYGTTISEQLCEYRMMMGRDYNFYADAEGGEEQLGLPGRVFLHKLPESTPDVQYYSLIDYPQRDLALRCNIKGSWAVPVFEQSGQTCVGVLELVSLYYMPSSWHDKSFLCDLYIVFQEFGLQCFDGYKHREMQFGDENEALTTAFQELKTVLRSVCEIHELPLAMTWVPCSACENLLRGQILSEGVEFCANSDPDLANFLKVSKCSHLRKGRVAGRALSSPNMLYCMDITQLSLTEYPLVHYARLCNFGGWFTMCLQSCYTQNDIYILEFFFPSTNRYHDIKTLLSLILGTMEENFRTFKLASGQELRDILSVEVVDFQNGQKLQSVEMIKATIFSPNLELFKDGGLKLQLGQLDKPSMDSIRNGINAINEEQNYNLPSLEPLQNGEVMMQLESDRSAMDLSNNGHNVITTEQNIIVVTRLEKGTRRMQERENKKTGVRIVISLEDILKYSEMSRHDAARKLKVSISTLKRVCRDYGIDRWPPRNIRKASPFRLLPVENQRQTPQLNSDLPSTQASASVAHKKPAFQDADMVTIRAKHENNTIKFRLSLSSRLVALQQEVAKRLNLEAGTYYVKSKDEEDELILIACDEDLQDCIHTSFSLGKTSIVVQLEPKQAITPLITSLNTAN